MKVLISLEQPAEALSYLLKTTHIPFCVTTPPTSEPAKTSKPPYALNLSAFLSLISDFILLFEFVYMCVCAQLLGLILLFVTPWTITCEAPLPMEFSRQEYWSGLTCPSPGDLFDPDVETVSLKSLE